MVAPLRRGSGKHGIRRVRGCAEVRIAALAGPASAGLVRGMDDRKSPPSLDDLADRVKRVRGGQDAARRKDLESGLPSSAMGLAFRVGVELVAGVIVGAAIGYGLDQWLGTKPWMLIVFFFLGAAGGMMNVYRAATGKGLSVGYANTADGDGSNEGGPKGSEHSDGGSPDGGKKEG